MNYDKLFKNKIINLTQMSFKPKLQKNMTITKVGNFNEACSRLKKDFTTLLPKKKKKDFTIQ